MSRLKKTMPRTSSATWVKLSMIQPTLNATASATRHAPSVTKNATDLRRRGLTRIERIVATSLQSVDQTARQSHCSRAEQHEPRQSGKARQEARNGRQHSRGDRVKRPPGTRGEKRPDHLFARTIGGRDASAQIVRQKPHQQSF